ncbi:hypothetical protein CRENBAI_008873 [Crenichthys baileyi]|uniref:Uncharacterized protein n=1 Tax=Crenichthys baileyi TaxID=28760 RepID=A0AAV9RMJ1_9TELE
MSCSCRTEPGNHILHREDRVARAAGSVETPRLPSPHTPPPAPWGEPKVFKGQLRDIVPPVCPWSRWDVPGTPPEEGVQEASDTDGRATSTDCSRCGGAAVLLRAPPRWPSSSPYPHSAANCPSACYRSWLEGASRTTS